MPLVFIPCWGKWGWDGDAGEQPELWEEAPSNTEESRTRHRMEKTEQEGCGHMAGSAELQCLTWESSRLTKNHFSFVYWTSQCFLMLHCSAGYPKSALLLITITASITNCPFPISIPLSFMSQECGGGRCNRNQSHLIISVYHWKLGKEKAESFPTTWGQRYLSSWLVLLFTKKLHNYQSKCHVTACTCFGQDREHFSESNN